MKLENTLHLEGLKFPEQFCRNLLIKKLSGLKEGRVEIEETFAGP